MMKITINPADQARRLARADRRQWSQVEVLLDNLADFHNALPAPEDVDYLRRKASDFEGILKALVGSPGLGFDVAASLEALKSVELPEDLEERGQAIEDFDTAWDMVQDALATKRAAMKEEVVVRAEILEEAWTDVVVYLDEMASALETLSTPVETVSPEE